MTVTVTRTVAAIAVGVIYFLPSSLRAGAIIIMIIIITIIIIVIIRPSPSFFGGG